MQVTATERAEQEETKGDVHVAMLNHSTRCRKNKEKPRKPCKHKYTNTHRGRRWWTHTHTGSALARALAAAAPALVLVRAKSRGRRVLPNAAVICFGNATAVSSHGPFWEMTARVGQGDSSVCSGAGTLQVMFSKALLNLMACKIR